MRVGSQETRSRNRFAVLRAIFALGTPTRQELAESTGLSTATVATIVAELIATGVVSVAAVERKGIGRPSSRLQVDEDRGRMVGVDVAETYVRATVFDLGLGALAEHRVELDEHENSPEYVVAGIVSAMRGAMTAAEVADEAVVGAGVSFPGQVRPEVGLSVFAPNWDWHDVRVEALLEAELGFPVHLDNPLKAIAAAEVWFGDVPTATGLVTVNLGTGVGAGFALHGAIVRGVSNNAGEWGHTMLVLDGRACRCGRTGCVEAYVGLPGIEQTLREIDPEHPALGLDRQTDFADAVRAGCQSGDPAMRTLMERTAHYLSAALGDIVNMVNPDQIRLTGWTVDRFGEWMIPLALAELDRHCLPNSYDVVTVAPTGLTGNMVALGMATLTLQHFLAGVGVPSRAT